MQPAIRPASEKVSAPLDCASQIRSSTVPNAWCGRTLHQSCVASTIGVRAPEEHPMKSARSRQSPNGSWTPQRGKVRVKSWVRTEWRPVSSPSRKGELAESGEQRRQQPRR